MTTYCRDISNYTVELTPELLAQWRAEGVGLIIIQAFPQAHRNYPEQRRQMAMCAQEGMPFDSYVYDYLSSPEWLTTALDGLEQAPEKPRKLWLDEEDTETEKGWTASARVKAIDHSIAIVKRRGYQVGIYTAAWWWNPKTRDFKGFAEYPLWTAQYDGIADANVFTPFGGWVGCRIKQYAGSQPDGTDLNVLSAAEESELLGTGGPPVPPPMSDTERETMQQTINSLVNSLGYIAGDLLAPVVPQTSNTQAVTDLVAGIRREADAHGIAHA